MQVFITGGSGSIGREVAKIFLQKGHKVTISGLSEERMTAALRYLAEWKDNLVCYFADIRDDYPIQPGIAWDLVVHCAAMKHVPLCENHPKDACDINVHGTRNLLSYVTSSKIPRFLAISTDKACMPDCTMGYTKALVERMIAMAPEQQTVVAGVRLGNVFPSVGSVLPIWEQQTKQGKAITLTNPEMTRFFIHIEKAAKFISEAALRAKHNEIWIPRMGAVRMGDLAKAFVAVAGNTRPIETIGVRPGEKLHEYLISDEEATRITERKYHYVLHPRPVKQTFFWHVRSDTNLMTQEQIKEFFFDGGLHSVA